MEYEEYYCQKRIFSLFALSLAAARCTHKLTAADGNSPRSAFILAADPSPGAGLSPLLSVGLPFDDTIGLRPYQSSSAEYIIHQFSAATGCRKLELKNIYASGKVAMAMLDHDPAAAAAAASLSLSVSHKGCLIIWQMDPNKWLIELSVGGHKVVAGSDGNVAWRHTPWLGAHAAKSGVRPLRRALQGLDPVGISRVFSAAEYMGKKHVLGVECFVLKVCAENGDLAERSDASAEMMKHASVGYFNQRSGLLLLLQDSYLTRIQNTPAAHPTYWETTISTKLQDYRPVEVEEKEMIIVSHTGQTTVVITSFGEDNLILRAGHGVTRMEETYTIDDLAFNVPGISSHTFIPTHLSSSST